jgi:phosphatidylserine/phosphatidylglycerophosphate/cardiolipin synthase-like enzyme
MPGLCVSRDVRHVEACSKNIQEFVVRLISTYGKDNMIAGCVAWFTNSNILACMRDHAREVAIVVNDEKHEEWAMKRYAELPSLSDPMHSAFQCFPDNPLTTLDRTPSGKKLPTCSYEAVRAYGNPAFTGSNSRYGGGGPAPSSMMHNKYLIFFENRRDTKNPDIGTVRRWPRAVLTGSFNMTMNANNNLENAVFIVDDAIAAHYFRDFANIFFNSTALRSDYPPLRPNAKR